jgi:ferredoxin
VPFVITQACIDTTDQSCVEVCPVDCIHFESGTDRMLYINPVECIDCGACQPACPVSAIYPEGDVPAEMQAYTALNELWYSDAAAARAQVAALVGGAGGGSAPQATPEVVAPTAEETPVSASAPAETGSAAADAAEAQAAAAAEAPAAAAPAAKAEKVWVPTPHAGKADFKKAFGGFHYPISRDGVIRMARDKGGLDREVARILAQLPNRKYRSEDELTAAVRDIYRMNGVPEDVLPV